MQTSIPSTPSRPPVDWRRAAEGIQLAGLAVFLLLNTSGVLPWSFWLDALVLWPVLIMSLGVRVAFEKTRVPWLLLLQPVLVLGSLAWIAGGTRLEGTARSASWKPLHASRPERITRVELAGELFSTQLQIGSVLGMPASVLVDGRCLDDRNGLDVELEAADGLGRARLRSGQGSFVALPGRKQRCELRLPVELPVAFHLSGAAVASRLDLTSGSFLGGQLDGVFMAADLRLPAPGQHRIIKVEGVFNALTLTVPTGTPVRVSGARLPFNALSRGTRGVAGRPGYEVKVQGIFTAVDVRREPPDRPPAPAEQPPPLEPSGRRTRAEQEP